MSNIHRLPTRFGQGHADAIAFFQDTLLPLLIDNKISTLVLRGIAADGAELEFTMIDVSGGRDLNMRTLAQLTEASFDWVDEMSAVAKGEWKP